MEPNKAEHLGRLQTVLENENIAATSDIAASWKRCLTVHKFNPMRTGAANVVTASELRESTESMATILGDSDVEVDRLFRLVRAAGYLVLVSDRNGVTVTERSDNGLRPEGTAPIVGANWSEDSEGTNGIGTSLALQRPLLVKQSEHLRLTNTQMLCVAAPLFDCSGVVAGAIDITTFRRDVSVSYLPLALSVVAEAARRIESRLFRQAFPKSFIMSLPDSESINNSVPLVALNSDYLVIGATRAVRKRKGLTDDMLKRGVPLIRLLPGLNECSPNLPDAERMAIHQALALHANNISATAAFLGISRATLYRKLHRGNRQYAASRLSTEPV